MEKSLADINEIVRQVGKLLRPLIDARIEVSTACRAESEPILADAGQLKQVLVNLSLNARDSITDTGRVAITTNSLSLDKDTADRLGRAVGDLMIHVSVADSGCGMSPAVRAKVFDPFFTTKAVGQGTGLGLSVVHGIVMNHQGAIEIESEVGHGTTFHLYFPITESMRGPARAELFSEEPRNVYGEVVAAADGTSDPA